MVGATQLPTPARAMPRKGGDFRVAVTAGGVSDTLNPAEASSAQQIVVGWGLRNCLTEIAADNSLAPELAQSWASDDGKTWVFQLRQGVTSTTANRWAPRTSSPCSTCTGAKTAHPAPSRCCRMWST
jgi:peptide/nickel transport system substrate-binding protein